MGQYFLLEMGDKPENGVDVEMGGRGCYFFYFLTVPFSHIYPVWGKVWYPFIQSFELAMQDFHPCSHSSLVLKPGFICAFLIHSGSRTKNVD